MERLRLNLSRDRLYVSFNGLGQFRFFFHHAVLQMVGMFPPSMTYSLPVIDEARSDARNATNSATSSGRFGLPKGMPPRESIMRCLADSWLMPVRWAISFTIPCAA